MTQVELSKFWMLASTTLINSRTWTTLIDETLRLQDSLDSAAIYISFVSMTKMRHHMLPHFANMICFLVEKAQKTEMQFKHLCAIAGCLSKCLPQITHSMLHAEIADFMQHTAEILPRRLAEKQTVAGQDVANLCAGLKSLDMRSEL